MFDEYSLQTGSERFYKITKIAKKSLAESGVQEGICIVC